MIMTTDNLATKDVFFFDRFSIGQKVRKKSGSEWEGRICGFYSTELTRNGYCVESSAHKGSVQIYPESALESCE